MCLAIGHKDCAKRGWLSRHWWLIADRPLMLFSFGALFHGLLISLLIATDWLVVDQLFEYRSLPLLAFGVVAWPMLAYLVQVIPQRLKTSEIDYASYGAAYNLGFIALLIAELAQFQQSIMMLLASGLLGIAWLICIRALRWSWLWGRGQGGTLLACSIGMMYSMVVVLWFVALLTLANISTFNLILSLYSLLAVLVLAVVALSYRLELRYSQS